MCLMTGVLGNVSVRPYGTGTRIVLKSHFGKDRLQARAYKGPTISSTTLYPPRGHFLV